MELWWTRGRDGRPGPCGKRVPGTSGRPESKQGGESRVKDHHSRADGEENHHLIGTDVDAAASEGSAVGSGVDSEGSRTGA